MIEVLKDIKLATGITIKKGAYVDMTDDGNILIKRNNEEFVWPHNTYEIYNQVRVQNGLKEI